MAGQPQTSVQQEEAITRLYREGVTNATRIHGELDRLGLLSDPHPSVGLRLVQGRVKKLREALSVDADTSGPWRFADADPEEARALGDVIAFQAETMAGRWELTKNAAEWVAKVRQAAPDTPASWALALGLAYRRLEHRPDDDVARLLDVTIAARPWESQARAQWFLRLLERIERSTGRHRPLTFWYDVAHLFETGPAASLGSLGKPWPESAIDKARPHHQRESTKEIVAANITARKDREREP